MKKVTWCCTPFQGGYVITASTWVRDRETRANLVIPPSVVRQKIPMRSVLAAAMDELLQALAEVGKMVPATH